jgi:predicted DsbA family dithiol-disulfide isomerase
VNGIPAVLIGPYALSGAVPFEDYEQATRAVLRDGHSGQEDSAAAAARPQRRPLRVR